jgi:hypothetical protein
LRLLIQSYCHIWFEKNLFADFLKNVIEQSNQLLHLFRIVDAKSKEIEKGFDFCYFRPLASIIGVIFDKGE